MLNLKNSIGPIKLSLLSMGITSFNDLVRMPTAAAATS